MMNNLVKLLMLGTFAFWATGLAQFVHVQIAHHGKIECCDDCDNCGCDNCDCDNCDQDSCLAKDTPTPHAADQHSSTHHDHGCAVCQMLTAMTVDRCSPPPCLAPTNETIFLITIIDAKPPFLRFIYRSPARAPPI
jgi:hypothetical protein